jgi:hypothetical protein
MKHIRRSRGIIYSLITLLLLVPLLVFLSTYLETAGSRDEVSALKIRGIELSNYANSVSEDVPRILRITSIRAIISAVNEIDFNGQPVENAQEAIVILMLNATYNGTLSNFMNSSSLDQWVGRMESQGAKYGMITNITIDYLNVTPYDSFHLQFRLILTINSTDQDDTIKIIRTYNESYIMPLVGLEDVLFPLNTNGFIRRTIKKANFDITNVSFADRAISEAVYISNNHSASFLDRMENKTELQNKYAVLSQNPIGLESFVNIQDISGVGLQIKVNQSIVDHQYFNVSFVKGCPAIGSDYSWFLIETSHATAYNISTNPC